jgi:chemotaxis protein MotB
VAGHRGRRGGGHEEEHENHERWLISYADMITLLMVLFVVMFAISNVDREKFAALSEGLATGFGAPRFVAVAGSDSVIQGAGPLVDPIRIDVVKVGPAGGTGEEAALLTETPTVERSGADVEAALEELQRLEQLSVEAEAALAAKGLQDRADFRITTDGLVIVLFADDVFFANGSAEIQPVGQEVVDALAPVLARSDNPVSAEGHANHLPISSGSIYPSNWELSAARAASVVRRLVEVDGLSGARLDATGYSDTRPLVPVGDPDAIETNRRVDLLVRSTAPADVRALLPGLAATRS